MLGILAARNNTIGFVGVAPGIPASNVYIWNSLYSSGGVCCYNDITMSDEAIEAAVQAGITIVIDAFAHTDYSQEESTWMAYAQNYNMSVIAPAGFYGMQRTANYPASYSGVIGVSGVTPTGAFASAGTCNSSNWTTGSDYGPQVMFAAPISGGSTYGNSAYYDLWNDISGHSCSTTISAAHVAGVLALVRDHHPEWTQAQARSILLSSSSGHGQRISDYLGYGLVDAYAAVTYQPISVSISGPTFITQKGTYTWTANGTPAYPYTYQWQINDGSGWTNLGTTANQTHTVSIGSGPFDLQVTISYGGWVNSATTHVDTCWTPNCLN